jgi:ABC-type transport system involved in multi-copper enzyme maturation permease subunit
MSALLRSEWTKFRTVPGWIVAVVLAAGVIVLFGVLPGAQGTCGTRGPGSECILPVGPEGQEVTDAFTFTHQSLTGDGSITVRVASLTGQLPPEQDGGPPQDAVAPWAKAGLIIKDGTTPGSAYAAVMVTGGHGVRLQYDYVHDQAGQPYSPGSARWLRLTRAGDTITGAESTNGTQWTDVGTARLAGLPSTVEAGLFVTSPQYAAAVSGPIGVTGAFGGPTQASAGFERIDRHGGWAGQDWSEDQVGRFDDDDAGAGSGPPGTSQAAGPSTGAEQTPDGFTLTGSGDIAPAVAGAAGIGVTITQTLVGTFLGLIVLVVIGALVVTAEYRRGLVRTTLAASPRRGRVLAAKAMVVGGVAFVTGLVAAAVVVTVGQGVLRRNGAYVHPASFGTELRVIVGTAGLLAVMSVLAVGLGALLRRGAAAVTTGILLIVLPYLLAVTVLPGNAAAWLLRVTPAAAFALQQSTTQYAQVDNLYTPADGYFPLAPWLGFAVLCAWAAAALGLATIQLRRRDA